MKVNWKITVIIIVALVLFFIGMPLSSYWLMPLVYGAETTVATATDGNCNPLNNFGLFGDSYGIWNAFFSALAFGGVIYTLYKQKEESSKRTLVEQYFKMLDFQQTLVGELTVMPVSLGQKCTATIKHKTTNEYKVHEEPSPIKGRKVFVEYKYQLSLLLKAINEINVDKALNLSKEDVADIAYAVFYYGAEEPWKSFMVEYLKGYSEPSKLADEIIAKIGKQRKNALGRPNQNYMSVYSRNMYNAIKLIDTSNLLSEDEKKSYLKLLRAQLSNAELYVLFFNLLSRFGKKWKENNYVEKYQLIQNLPLKYCEDYNPKTYFPNIIFEGEEGARSAFK